MSDVSGTGLDLAGHVFQVHGADASGQVVVRKQLRRGQVLEFFGRRPACVVAMRPARALTIGAGRSPGSGTRCG